MAEKLDPEAKRLRNISPGDLADAIGALEAGPSASDAEIHKLYRCHDRLLVQQAGGLRSPDGAVARPV